MKRAFYLLLAGVAIGVLIAPEKGSVIRQKICDLIDDLSEAGKHIAERADTNPDNEA